MTMTIITWVLTALSLAGTVLVIRRRVEGFYLWAFTNIGWVVVDIEAGLYAQAALFGAYLALSVYGVWEWRREAAFLKKED